MINYARSILSSLLEPSAMSMTDLTVSSVDVAALVEPGDDPSAIRQISKGLKVDVYPSAPRHRLTPALKKD